jgi:predicted GNAT family acetyltransferase
MGSGAAVWHRWGVLRVAGARLLDDRDRAGVRAILESDPVASCMVAARVEVAGLDPWRLGGEMWGWYEDGMLTSLCYAGANLVPICATPRAVRAFADRARRAGRRCSSIVGPAEPTAQLWRLLEPSWGPARDVREVQPFLTMSSRPLIEPDPLVRRVRPDELDQLYNASVAFFTEELGISPESRDGGSYYRTRVADLIGRGYAFARIEDGEIVFKAEVGVATPSAFQIQGVWVRPDRRGEGLSAPGVAAVVAAGLREIAPVATLYVNDFNVSARRAYSRVGFRPTATFMTVLF